MQLHLETDEFEVLANILLEQLGKKSAARFQRSQGGVQFGPRFLDDLVDKILAKDLRLASDELVYLDDLLTSEKRKLAQEVGRPENAARQAELQQKLRVMARMLERIQEACVMF